MTTRTDDLIALNDLMADQWERIDQVTQELVTDLFTDDAEMKIGRLERCGREQIQAYAVDRRASEAASGRRTRHAMTNVRVAFTSDDEAEMRFLLIVFAGSGTLPFASAPPSNIADFAATCRRVDGGWRIASLRGEAIFAGPDAPVNAR